MKALTAEQTFIINEVWVSAWSASVQRAKLFAGGSTGNSAFRSEIRGYVEKQVMRFYEENCSEKQHLINIGNLVDFGTKVLPVVLKDGTYKYGVAQKLLNLVLKYHWCLGHIAEPPHCPVDRIIIEKTKFRGKINWTEIRTEAAYCEVIEAIRKVTGGESLARWELTTYARR